MICHVIDIGKLDRIERKYPFGKLSQNLTVSGTCVGCEEDIPVSDESLVCNVKQVRGSFLAHIIADSPHQAKIPLGCSITEFTYINPQGAFAICDDIANMKVSVYTFGRIGHMFYECKSTTFVFIGNQILFRIELQYPLLVGVQLSDIGFGFMQFAGQTRKLKGYLFKPFRLL